MTRRLPEPGPGHTSWMAVILRITAISASAPRRAPASAACHPWLSTASVNHLTFLSELVRTWHA